MGEVAGEIRTDEVGSVGGGGGGGRADGGGARIWGSRDWRARWGT